MNVTLIIDNLSSTAADREVIIDKYFQTDRCLRGFEIGYGYSVWKHHLHKYNSRIVKLVIINFDDNFKRHIRDIVKEIPDEQLFQIDVIEIDDNIKTRMIPFMQLIQEEWGRDKYFKIEGIDPEENYKFNRRIDYLRSKY